MLLSQENIPLVSHCDSFCVKKRNDFYPFYVHTPLNTQQWDFQIMNYIFLSDLLFEQEFKEAWPNGEIAANRNKRSPIGCPWSILKSI